MSHFGRKGREWAHRLENAVDTIQDGEGLLEALHDAQPDQEVLQHSVQSPGWKDLAKFGMPEGHLGSAQKIRTSILGPQLQQRELQFSSMVYFPEATSLQALLIT